MDQNSVIIQSEWIRLDSFLKYSGCVSTGGQAKFLIQQGEVFVNGEICTQRGKKLHPGDIVTFHDVNWTIRLPEIP